MSHFVMHLQKWIYIRIQQRQGWQLTVLKRTLFIEYLGSKLENREDDPQRPRRSSKTTKSRSKRKSAGPTSSKSKSLEWDTLENPEEEPTIAPKSKEKTIGESPMKSGRVKHTAVKRGREVLNVDTYDSSQHDIEEQLASKVARSSSVNKGTENTVDLEQEPSSLHPSKDNSPVTLRRSRTPSPSPSPQRDLIPSQGVQTPLLEEISPAPGARFEGNFELEVQPVNFDFPERETSTRTAQDAPLEDTEVVVQESTSHQTKQDQLEAKDDQPVAAKTFVGPPETIEVVDDNSGVDEDTGSLDEDDDEDDPLKLIKDILSGKTSMSSKSLHSNAHFEVKVQSISTTQLLNELAALLNLGLDHLMASEDNKHKMTTLLEQVGQHSQLLNPDVRQAVQKLRGLFKDLMANFFHFQQAITNHQQLLDTKVKLMNVVTKAKRRRSKLNTTLSTTQQRINQNEGKIVELEAQLHELKKQQEDLQAKIGKVTTQEQQLKSDYSKWVFESTNVMATIETSMPAFEKASAERKKAEETVESLQFFFNHL